MINEDKLYKAEDFRVMKAKIREINLNNAKELETDLVQASYFFGCCSECAKYRGRWFSISGEDKRFPKMPEYECSCPGMGIDFSPVIDGISQIIVGDWIGEKVDIIQFSNRPFIDDRSEQEKEIYKNDMEELKKKAQKEVDRREYSEICKLMPEKAPKNFTAYRRMKKAGTESFKELAELAKEKGVEIKLDVEK